MLQFPVAEVLVVFVVVTAFDVVGVLVVLVLHAIVVTRVVVRW